MQLKDIKSFIQMAMQGDATIESRLTLILKQKEAVRAQILCLAEAAAKTHSVMTDADWCVRSRQWTFVDTLIDGRPFVILTQPCKADGILHNRWFDSNGEKERISSICCEKSAGLIKEYFSQKSKLGELNRAELVVRNML